MRVIHGGRPTTRRLLTVPEAAEQLGISRTTMYAVIQRGDLPVVRIGRVARIDPADLEVFISENKFG